MCFVVMCLTHVFVVMCLTQVFVVLMSLSPDEDSVMKITNEAEKCRGRASDGLVVTKFESRNIIIIII